MNESSKLLFMCGGAAASIAALAWIADYRRHRRKNPDKVGFMPWTTIFVIAMFASVMLLGIAAREMFA